jgi:hypothetical protein
VVVGGRALNAAARLVGRGRLGTTSIGRLMRILGRRLLGRRLIGCLVLTNELVIDHVVVVAVAVEVMVDRSRGVPVVQGLVVVGPAAAVVVPVVVPVGVVPAGATVVVPVVPGL